METPGNMTKYEQHYSELSLWEKIKKVAKRAGVKVVYAALLLYYVLVSQSTTNKDKAKIIGALGYFILPMDIIPDWILGLGFVDDMAALTWALYAVGKNVTPEIKDKSKAKLAEFFGQFNEADLEGLL